MLNEVKHLAVDGKQAFERGQMLPPPCGRCQHDTPDASGMVNLYKSRIAEKNNRK
jgi:hypothetical protein